LITVNDVAPSSLSYASPNVFTVGSTISNLNPSISGVVLSYSITPALPSGLNFNTTTGVISGTPSAVSSTATYTVTATNSGGSSSFGVVIAVNDISPNSLSYPTPNTFTRNTTITSLNPSVSGGSVSNYSISPSLPSGLNFNSATGVISGTPSAVSSANTYTVTATNSGGSTSFGVVITVNDVAPSSLSYASPNVFTVGTTISNLLPSFTGSVTSFSIAPSLPAGLNFDTATGVISGTPTEVSSSSIYIVTATNSGGSTSFGVIITVNDAAPSSLSYSSPNVFTIGTTISNLLPSFNGNVISFSIVPSLPAGLNFDTATGEISGTPTEVSSSSIYTVTATNSGGSTSFGVIITVNDAAPSSLSYSSPNVFTIGTTISNLLPSFNGNVISFSIVPSLPVGLNFDTATGEISGTPTEVSSSSIYTVTATNSGGTTSFDIEITINALAPSTLTYPSPNVFTVGTTISNLFPSFTGSVTSFSIVPSLPAGLNFDTATGVISGTPTEVSSSSIYTVTALNSGGTTSFDIEITINAVAPSTLNYPSPNVFTVGTTISNLFPSFTGSVTSFSIAPSLPAGLTFDTATGEISGTPTEVSSSSIYTVTATNSGGSTSFGVIITVNDAAPSSLSYSSPNVFTIGTTISNLLPSFNGNVISFSIVPSLPAGLTFDTATGEISGTPTEVSSSSIYTVTATNSGGSISFDIEITVEDVLNTNSSSPLQLLIYPNPFIDTVHVEGIHSGGTYKVYSIEGRLIQNGALLSNQIELSSIPTGVYLLHLYSENKEGIYKIIKR